jgi:GDP-L-fucose synthase
MDFFKDKKVYVAGHNGMVGSALVRRLQNSGCQILTASREELDLLRQESVETWMQTHQPDYVFLAAAKVGGILANSTYVANFIYENLMIETNIIEASRKVGVKKLLFLGSSCIYPKMTQQPIRESQLLEGSLEPTNQWYAIAKIAGLKLCEAYRIQYGCDYISAMPTNLYGPNDHFDLNKSHVLPALLRKIHEAKEKEETVVEIWGSGTPRREFLHVDDLADALIFLMKNYSENEHINVGVGYDLEIKELAHLIAKVVGYQGSFIFDGSKPDGTPKKCLNVDKLETMGWTPKISLEEGIRMTYRWYLEFVNDLKI